jgi:hydroxymethylpyrimidine pyrophosphatase-like HAD family hydrolase
MQAILNKYKNDYVISSSSKKNIEINALGVNKGNALVRLCNFLNIDTKNIMTIGDEHNDVPMFKLTPYSVSFHSSPKDVKQYAGFIFDLPPSVLVGKAIEEIILKNDN